MKKLILLTVFACFGTLALTAQSYDSSVGARFGSPLMASYKTFISEKAALEGMVGFRSFSSYNWINVAAAYQIHNPIGQLDGLSWYYGFGGSVYFWSFDNNFGTDESSVSLGIQGYIGLDYAFEDFPLNLSIDWVPTIFLNGFGNGFGGDYGALSARYILD